MEEYKGPGIEEQDDNYSREIELPFLREMTGWTTFKAVIDIIVGALTCLGVITAIYGIPKIIAGIRLLNVTDDLKSYIASGDTRKIGDTLYNVYKHFKLTGISIIIQIIFVIIVLCIYIVLIIYLINNPDNFNGFLNDYFQY